ncbi:MDR family MFS transporter [Ureibacillus sp. GCM10028918]|uniref:MDR family MFS transporter n=1 Tax=Ureibacillus sp. GCM10028918 TaxID=3273429 RepID=UPI003615F453
MKWKDYPQNVKVRLLTSFFNRALSASVLPFMALYFAQEWNKVSAGIFLVITVVISFIFNLIGGYMADRFSRKKLLLITSFFTAVMFLLMTVSLLPEQNLVLLFAFAYIIFTVTSSLEYPTMDALIIDSTTPGNRKAIYTADYWLHNLSMAIGTAIGGLLYVSHKIELFSVLSVISGGIFIVYALWLNDIKLVFLKQEHNNAMLDIIHNYKMAFRDRSFVLLVAGLMCINAAELSLNNYIAVRLAEDFERISIGDFQITGIRMLSILNVENMLLVVLLTFFVSRLTDRFSKRRVIFTGLIVYGIGYVMVTSANPWYLLVFFNFVATIGELIYSPIMSAQQASMMPEDKRGSYAAFANLGYTGGDLIARFSLIIGAFLLPTEMSIYIGAVIVIGIILVYKGLLKTKESQEI